ncbi:MFS transporter [Paracoccus alkanivorans]|uniref:MFS transporter n=1 Tax=Paracoccus alkanivorans TaxID=2116655 RepID=A0A3M0MK60_9RHOB|nr:MFS transporter [Paracoccus alkanivorans]RMC37991.1 MFS transporter [Paracoccus alkanivorans]
MSLADSLTDHGGRKAGWSAILIIAGAGTVSAFQVGKVPMALSTIQDDLGLSLALASWLISAFAVVGAGFGTPIGLAVDRVGARRMVVGGLLLQALGSGLGGMAGGTGPLILSRVVEGLGFVSVLVAAPTIIFATVSAELRDRAIAVWATVMPVGMTAVMLSAPLFAYLEWRGFWMLNAAILLAYGLIFAASIPARKAHGHDQNITEQLTRVVAAPGPWALAALFAAFSAAFFAIFGFLPTLLAEQFGLSQNLASAVAAISVAASGLGNLVSGVLLSAGRRPAHILTAGFLAMTVFGFGVLAAGLTWPFVAGFAVLFSFMAGLIPVVLMGCVPKLAPRPDLVGATMGFAIQGNNVGMLAGPATAGGLAAGFGWGSVAIAVAAVSIAAIALAWTILTDKA